MSGSDWNMRSVVPQVARSAWEIDATVPHIARIYDFWLGGKDNFEVDREAGRRVAEANPTVYEGVRANRAFLARSVRYPAGRADVTQFLDLGTGSPAANNTHEVAHKVAPGSRVVYVDNDPIVLAHARALLRRSRSAPGSRWGGSSTAWNSSSQAWSGPPEWHPDSAADTANPAELWSGAARKP